MPRYGEFLYGEGIYGRMSYTFTSKAFLSPGFLKTRKFTSKADIKGTYSRTFTSKAFIYAVEKPTGLKIIVFYSPKVLTDFEDDIISKPALRASPKELLEPKLFVVYEDEEIITSKVIAECEIIYTPKEIVEVIDEVPVKPIIRSIAQRDISSPKLFIYVTSTDIDEISKPEILFALCESEVLMTPHIDVSKFKITISNEKEVLMTPKVIARARIVRMPATKAEVFPMEKTFNSKAHIHS